MHMVEVHVMEVCVCMCTLIYVMNGCMEDVAVASCQGGCWGVAGERTWKMDVTVCPWTAGGSMVDGCVEVCGACV